MARSNDDESSAQVGWWQARQEKNIARSSLHKFTDHGDALLSVTICNMMVLDLDIEILFIYL